jgi:hypothetical protein
MIHAETAFHRLQESFVGREFSAREADGVLPFTHGTTLVALSQLVKAGMLVRKRKGVYSIKAEERGPTVRELKRPEIRLARGYATGTYALSSQLSPITASKYIDLVVPLKDYPAAVAAIEVKGTFPEPRVHPSHRSANPLRDSIDGLKIPLPEVAFVDLIKIAVERRRPVSLEYEILPFIPQLAESWGKIRTLAAEEGVADYLEAVLSYVAKVAARSGSGLTMPTPRPREGKTLKTLSFAGGKADEVSVDIGGKTGVVVEADQEAVKGVLSNL